MGWFDPRGLASIVFGLVLSGGGTVTFTFNPPVVIGAAAALLNIDVANSLSADSAGNIIGFNFGGSSFTFRGKAIAAEDRQQGDDGEMENVIGLVTGVLG